MKANNTEELLLRHWYETRGCNRPLTEQSFHTIGFEVQQLQGRDFAFNKARLSVVAAFANSCLVVRPPKHRARELTVEEFLGALAAAIKGG